MPRPPQRYKDELDLDPDEVLRARAGEKVETDDYRAYVRRVHEAAGLEPPASARERPPLDELSPEDHLEQIKETR